MELTPLKATFAPGEEIVVEVAGAAGEVDAVVTALDQEIARAVVEPGEHLVIPPLPQGGYGVSASSGDTTAETAFDVLSDPLRRPRYGFVADFSPARDTAGATIFARQLHLNAIQFYDWMYRHAKLVPPTDTYTDPLGRTLTLASVQRLIAAYAEIAALPTAYAAVYAVGRDEWPEWKEIGLFRPDGTPWQLGDDFLWLLDPAHPRWLDHFTNELREAEQLGFAAFHLDQYGWPKEALRGDGHRVDVAASFLALLRHLENRFRARLIFNNVNAFPVWATAPEARDAVYAEVWSPHDRLEDLAAVVSDARRRSNGKVPIIAAYLPPFLAAREDEARAAMRLVMATIFSHGGTHLIAGDDGRVLVDPYYARNHRANPETRQTLRRFFDFAVRYGDVLYADGEDVTRTLVGGVNEEIRLAGARIAVHPEPGTIWVRAVHQDARLVLHLIDLTHQDEVSWCAAKRPAPPLDRLLLSLQQTRQEPVAVKIASPDAPGLTGIQPEVSDDGRAVFLLPPWSDWAVVIVEHGL